MVQLFRVGKFRSEYMSELNFDTRIDSGFAKHTSHGKLTKSLKLILRLIKIEVYNLLNIINY